MKRLSLILFMMLALGASWTTMAQQCDPTPISPNVPWTEDFSLEDWPYSATQNGNYNLFSEFSNSCWLVPYTIEASNSTISPRLWYNGEGNNRHISMKEGSETTKRDQIVALPVFDNPLNTLTIQFKSKLNMNGPRTLKIGYYDTEEETFTVLESIRVYGIKYQQYGPYILGNNANTPTENNANYRLAFMLPANANGYSCDVQDIVISFNTIPTEISSQSEWDAFCQAVNNGHNYSGQTVTLMNDITTAVTTRAGTSDHPFSGTFDGNGHTLTVNIPSSGKQGNAPFQYISGATIQNLVVNGMVTAGSGNNNYHAAGLVGFALSGTNTLRNCRVNASVITSTEYTGGIIGHGKTSNIIMEGCAYTGEITATGTNYVGGLIGWSDNLTGLTITDCFFNGSYANPNVNAKFHPIGCSNHADDITATRTITNTYYTLDPSNMDDAPTKSLVYNLDYQGKHAYSITGVDPVTVAMSGSATYTYNWSGITAYRPGIVYNSTIYAGDGENVALTLTGAQNYTATSGTLSGEGDSYTLIMEASNTVISSPSSGCTVPTNVTATNVMPTTATLNWTGEAESYKVRYRVVGGVNYDDPSFYEDFENGLPLTWTTIDADDDGHNWYGHINYTGSGNLATHSGNGVVASDSYDYDQGALNPDNWLITPKLDLGGMMSIWLRGQEDNFDYDEHFAIYLSLTGTAISDFAIVVPESVTTNKYVEYTADLRAYAGQQGYIAIRHFNCSDQFILDVDDFGIYPIQETEWTNTISETNSLNITNLTPATAYEFQVQAVCGENDESSWSTIATFTSPDFCASPTNLTAEVTGNAVELNWEGYQESYNVRYRTTGFDGIYLHEPLTINQIGDWETDDSGNIGLAYTDEDGTDVCFMFHYSTHPPQLLYSPYFPRPTKQSGATLQFDYKVQQESYPETFKVLYYDENNNLLLEEEQITVSNTYWITYRGYVPMGTKRFLIKHLSYDQFYLFLDNFFVYNDDDNEVGNWMPATSNDNTLSLNLSELESESLYEWQVQGVNCDGNGSTTDWSESASFSIGYIKHIDPYTSDGGYYLIASPIGQVNPTEVGGMLDNQYDLYYFDPTRDKEWINYKGGEHAYNPGFDLEIGKGYLYANSGNNGEGIDLVFNGSAYDESDDVILALESGVGTKGLNLVGNPFAETAYIDRPFYIMNSDGSDIIPSAAIDQFSIAPMEGVFVEAYVNDNETLTFTTTPPEGTGSKGLALNISEGRGGVIDRAIVCFGEGRELTKFQLFENSSKLFIPMDGKDYAVVRSEAQGELPVSFKAKEDGQYTITVSETANCQLSTVNYLHLIDNMTGKETDLLASPSYTFEAKTSDYENRFKLVFVCGDANDDNEAFAFISNGNLIVNGEGTLQVIDMLGHQLLSRDIHSSFSIPHSSFPTGVYVLRLINDKNVRVQKVVVK